MKAAVFYAANEPLRVETVPTPEPGPGELLIKVAACGLCHTDLHYNRSLRPHLQETTAHPGA